MAKITSIVLLLLITAVYSSSSDYHIDLLDLNMMMDFPSSTSMQDSETTSFPTSCRGGTIGECVDEEEFQLDSETHRRILYTRRYISYGALRRNYVPCSHRGASYYNCRPGASANPYHRGCSRITRCRR